jgi:Tfp pilus assembly protein PilF
MREYRGGVRGRRGAALAAALLLLALPLAAQKNFNQSEKMTVEKFSRARARYENGLEWLDKGQPERARKEAQASMSILPDYSDAHLLLAMVEYRRGDFAAALAEAEKAERAFAAMKELYAVSYQDYIDRLREQRERTAQRLSEQGLSLILMREAEIRLAAIDEKLREWRPTVDLDMPAAYPYVHGNILFKMRRFSEAREQYRAAVKADPRHAHAWNNLISIHFAAHDIAGAAKYVQEAEAGGVKLNEKLKQAVLEAK